MRATHWLNRLRKNESGNILALGAAAMPLLIASAAFAVDTIQLSLWQRQLQRTADSGAIAGAYALTQNRTDAQIRTSVANDLEDNTHPPLIGQPEITRGARAGYTQAVHVRLRAQRELPFMSIFTGRPAPLNAEATAALVGEGVYCMVSLYEGTSPGIEINGNADVTLGCGMITNSTAPSAVTAGGSSSVTASPIGAVGGIDGSNNNFGEGTKLLPFTARQSDPLGNVPNPTLPAGCSTSTTLSVHNGEVVTLPANSCYGAWDIKPGGTVKLQPGNHFINAGDATIQGNVQSVGTTAPGGSTIVMTSASGEAGDLKINAQAELNLTAPESGDNAGIAFYRDRRASNLEIKINGGAESKITGAFYAASSDIAFVGNAEMDVECLQMVGQRLSFRGTAAITNECPSDSDLDRFKRRIVRLVE